MKIKKLLITEIDFRYCLYDNELKESIKRIGLSFPIKVSINNGRYRCVDGHKRLSIMQDLLQEGKEAIECVNVVVTNDGSSRSNDCWRGRNTH